MERLVREVRSALHRRRREQTAARRAVIEQIRYEMRETLTALLLSCELAMSVPDVPVPAVERIRSIGSLARTAVAPAELISSAGVEGLRRRWSTSSARIFDSSQESQRP